MASNQEKGRAKTISNFTLLRINVSQFDSRYNPSNPALLATALQAKEADAIHCMTAFNNAQAPYTTAANDRSVAFAPVDKLITRVRREVLASNLPKDAKEETMINVDELMRKYKGKRANNGSVAKGKDKQAGESEVPDEQDKISVAHLSFVQRANTLSQLNALLANIPAYNPNIEELKLKSLTDLQTALDDQNRIVSETIVVLENVRQKLKVALDAPDTGLVDIALATKDAVASAFGHGSFEHKQISKLSFSRERD